MTPKSYIKNKLAELVQIIDTAKISYQFKESSEIHFFKIEPAHLYDNNEFIDFYGEMLLEFMDLFPYKSIACLNDDTIKLTNIEYTIEGCNYTN